ncbi:MAG: TetR family transcriptional regulator, partial [Desulfobacterales bacterium]|nr:TetR family transcriptional regulator [Desulfobacterales bacterium]
DILISLFEEQMQVVIEKMMVQVSQNDDPAKKLEIFALTHLQMIEQNTDLAEIIQVELRQSSKFMKEYNNEKFAQYLNIIGDIIKQGKDKGVFKNNVVPRVAKRAFFGALDEVSRAWVLSNRKKYDTDTAAQQISEYFLKGIGRRD